MVFGLERLEKLEELRVRELERILINSSSVGLERTFDIIVSECWQEYGAWKREQGWRSSTRGDGGLSRCIARGQTLEHVSESPMSCLTFFEEYKTDQRNSETSKIAVWYESLRNEGIVWDISKETNVDKVKKDKTFI